MDDERICRARTGAAPGLRRTRAASARSPSPTSWASWNSITTRAPVLARDTGKREVVVEDCSRPPLEDDDLGACAAQESESRASDGTEYQSTPSSAGEALGVSPISVICAPTRVRPGYSRRGKQSPHQQRRRPGLCSSRALTSVERVVGDPAQEQRSRAQPRRCGGCRSLLPRTRAPAMPRAVRPYPVRFALRVVDRSHAAPLPLTAAPARRRTFRFPPQFGTFAVASPAHASLSRRRSFSPHPGWPRTGVPPACSPPIGVPGCLLHGTRRNERIGIQTSNPSNTIYQKL